MENTFFLITHRTAYRYDRPSYLSTQYIRLKPVAHCVAAITDYALVLEPANHLLRWQRDLYGNEIARADFDGPVETLSFTVTLTAAFGPYDPFNFLLDGSVQQYPFSYDAVLKNGLSPYLVVAPAGPALAALRDRTKMQGLATIDFVVSLNTTVFTAIAYTERYDPGVQTCEETLQRASGSCRDTAWLLVQLMRLHGLAAAFVSGYLVEADPAVERVSLHAWAEVYLPGAGWIGLDPTSGLFTTEYHIPLACAPEPETAAALTGTTGAGEASLTFSSSLTHIE